ncbi:hypothetical protein [Caballeronia sp. SL2Y3]|uniref:hypothetical protein n=1 Tax=Caballeronia sp. SL2Y3 TaxID=2878151 RepID=UPI001FD0AEE4|nr:hypothetical protein [Caballeronia sp. SL2Y3]
MKRSIITAAALAIAATTAMAAGGAVNHDIEGAHQLVDQGYRHIEAAQSAGRGQFGGHAEKAKQLLKQAQAELDQAAVYYAEHHR